MNELLGGISTAVALVGVVLNNRRDRRCFYLWLVSNLLVMVVHVRTGLWSLGARDLAFFVLAVHGLHSWRPEGER